ncbi:MAG: hypothetical protein JW881_10910 [Spirochaetales bacterium]|nr:hypothetical protein [Spirochaetales bacterium]
MADCECLGGCIFFNDKMGNMPSIASIMKQNYCKTNNSGCARYMVFKALGKEKVPGDLFPNNVEKAKQIIAKG